MTTGPYEARYAPPFVTELERLDPPTRRRILEAIERKLLHDPHSHAKKLKGKQRPGQWRFRVGDYRVRFDLEGNKLVFYRVRHRSEIYE